MVQSDNTWKVCSTCRRSIEFGTTWYACSVTTCNRKRTGLFFCSMNCFEAHVPIVRHRDAWAEENKAPSREHWDRERAEEQAESASAQEAARRAESPAVSDNVPEDVLVVVSKLKAYVRARSGMNTSDTVVEPLSDHLRKLCNEAIRNAARDGRKTLMDRDFLALFK